MTYQEFISSELVKIEGVSLLLAKKTHNIAEINLLAEKGYVPALEEAIIQKAKLGEDYSALKELFKNKLPKEVLKEGRNILNKKIEANEPLLEKRRRASLKI